MKKMRPVILTIMAMLLSLSLASCTDAETVDESTENSVNITTEAPVTEEEPALTPEELFEKIDEKMDSYDSYESTISVIMNVTINGVEISTKVEGLDIRKGLATDNFEFYSEMKTTLTSSMLPEAQKMTLIKAYHGGNYFISNSGNDMKQKIYSPMTREEAEEYESGKADPFEYGDCVNKEAVKNDDGTWTLTFSGYTAKTVKDIIRNAGLDISMLNADVIDATLSVFADAELNATELSFSFKFEETPGIKLPEISVKSKFSKYNEAEIKTSSINPDQYQKVDDVRLIDEITELLAARMEQEDGEFDLKVTQTAKVMGQSQYSEETDHVVYGVSSDGFYYDIDAVMGGTNYKITYSKGVHNVRLNDQNQSTRMSDEDARTFIEGLINSAKFDAISVIGISKASDSEIVFTCEPKAVYEAAYQSMGATYRSVVQTITFTLENGKIVKISSVANAKGAITQGNNTFEVGLTVTSDLTFNK